LSFIVFDMSDILVGFIGQWFIGRNLADDFERRSYRIFRYSKRLDTPENRQKLSECDIVFIGVPTPTTPEGFNSDTLREVLGLVWVGKTAVIKSTMMPGTCEKLQALYPDRFVFHSPEFLAEKTAAYDVANPTRNIVGYPIDSAEYRARAQEVMDILPDAPVSILCTSREAEFIKYGSNCFLYLKVVYANILADLSKNVGANWDVIAEGIGSDPRIGGSHLQIVHTSWVEGDIPGRWAGGHCFIKDFAGLVEYIKKAGTDSLGEAFLSAAEQKNISLLLLSKKDPDLLEGVYGNLRNS
jgi:UDPglucose 6-dehydrogenase